MTNILLTIIIILLVARLIVNIWLGRSNFQNTYAVASDVENRVRVSMNKEIYEVERILKEESEQGFELFDVESDNENNRYFFFFTKKKIRNHFQRKS